MTTKRMFAVILLVGAVAGIAWQRSTLARLHQENGALRPLHEETARLEFANVELASSRNATTAQAGDTKAELLRLRNEVRQLRAQRQELDRLKQENERLAADMRAGGEPAQKFSEMEGFVAKESWSNAGFDTPEAAVQTFFWAMREGDIKRLADCMPEKDRAYLAVLAEPGHEQEREKLLGDFQGMTAGIGFRVVEKVVQEEGFLTKDGVQLPGTPRVPLKVQLKLQAVAGGATWPVSLKLYPDGWKMRDI